MKKWMLFLMAVLFVATQAVAQQGSQEHTTEYRTCSIFRRSLLEPQNGAVQVRRQAVFQTWI